VLMGRGNSRAGQMLRASVNKSGNVGSQYFAD